VWILITLEVTNVNLVEAYLCSASPPVNQPISAGQIVQKTVGGDGKPDSLGDPNVDVAGDIDKISEFDLVGAKPEFCEIGAISGRRGNGDVDMDKPGGEAGVAIIALVVAAVMVGEGRGGAGRTVSTHSAGM
jgi:hypothetical protein